MINFQIATPERVVLKEKIDKVSIPTELGEITILPGHIPLIANVVPGELTIYKNSDIISYSVTGGFVEIRPGDNVIILANAAEHVEEIDVARAEQAAEKAKKMMEGVKADDVKFAEASALLERSLARLKVARKKKHRDTRTPFISQG
jgi:F-type H+-transporting ATPase subunit epsilon